MECFICAEMHPPLYRVCNCQTVVHEKCFEKLVNVSSHATHCAVCRKQYDMSIYSRKQIKCHKSFGSMLFVLSSVFIADIFAIITISHESSQYQCVFYWILSILGFLLLGTIIMLIRQYNIQTKHWCCIWRSVEPVRKVIHLPNPIAPTNICMEESDRQEYFL